MGELDQIDQALYRAIAASPSPSLDLILSRLSSAADHSKLWFAVAAALALTPGRGGPHQDEGGGGYGLRQVVVHDGPLGAAKVTVTSHSHY